MWKVKAELISLFTVVMIRPMTAVFLRYVRVAEGGLVAGPNNEINGVTLQGVGHGTIIEYVQVHN